MVENADDMPYVALQSRISGVGILSRDKDIARLGGKPLALDFVLSVRSYARATSYAVGIRAAGTIVGWISVAALCEVVKGITAMVTKLPDWAKVGLLIGVIAIVLHPGSKKRVTALLADHKNGLSEFWQKIEKMMVLAAKKQAEAVAANEKIEMLLQS